VLKLVTAVVKPHKFDDVKEALKGAGVTGVTVTEVKGFGRQGGKTETFRGSEYKVELLPKLKVEVVVDESVVATVVEAIKVGGETGKIGDGKIWVLGIDELVRIRTGEVGVDAV
jgi:nitrogen regulatory protein P-II 1